jgi:hypothetical protein
VERPRPPRGHRWKLEGLWDGSQAWTTTTARYGAGAEHASTSEADRGHGAALQGVRGRLSGGQQRGFGAGWTGSTREAVTAADRSPGWDELGWLVAAVGGGGSNTARAGASTCTGSGRGWRDLVGGMDWWNSGGMAEFRASCARGCVSKWGFGCAGIRAARRGWESEQPGVGLLYS